MDTLRWKKPSQETNMGNLIAGVLIVLFIAGIAARIALHSTINELKKKGWLK